MFFKVTLTTSGGFSIPQLEVIKEYFVNTCSHVYISVEYGQSGSHCHLEGVVEFDTEKTSNITVRIKSLYKRLTLEWTPHSVKVKKVTHLIGAIIYASKELKDKGELLSIKGWKQSWIDLQIKENIKSIPFKVLKSKNPHLTQSTGGRLMYEYATAHNMRVFSKEDYFEVSKKMAADGYLFGSIRHKGIYQDVCSCFGDGSAVEAVARSELMFL